MSQLRFRPAVEADSERLWRWRNDPQAVMTAIQQRQVPLEEHESWFSRSLMNPRRKILICEDAATGEPVGMARFDWDESRHLWELSWTVPPEHRGRGVGRRLVGLASKMESRLYARVKSDNLGSLKVAREAGFETWFVHEGVEYLLKED